MIKFVCVLRCLQGFRPELLNLNAVRINVGRSLCVNVKRQCSAFTPRYTCCASRHDALRSGTRLYSSTENIEKELSAQSTDITEAPDVSKTVEDFKQRAPQPFNIDVLVSVLRQENAGDICVIKVPQQLKYTDYFVVVSGSSRRHLIAMAEYAVKVYKSIKRDNDHHVKIEGKNADNWLCVDFGHTVVHFMLPETRELYELEKLWTLRSFDEQLSLIPAETLPEDFVYEDDSTSWRTAFGEGGGVEQL